MIGVPHQPRGETYILTMYLMFQTYLPLAYLLPLQNRNCVGGKSPFEGGRGDVFALWFTPWSLEIPTTGQQIFPPRGRCPHRPRSENFKILFALLIFITFISCKEPTLFTKIESTKSGLDFKNQVFEKDSMSLAYNYYFYNGGGVTVADFNGDDLEDIFFTGNHVPSRMYVNKGNLKFEDVTEKANLLSQHWASGSNYVDINNDGRQDLFVCTVGKNEPNHFYINQGNDKNGMPIFKDLAPQMGLAEPVIATQSAFLDYDHDGDLDMFLAVNSQLMNNRNEARPRNTDFRNDTRDRLYRNNGNNTFTNVSAEAGIINEGYALGVAVSDFNNDGWLDIYVANDFLSNDLLYINNQKGGFEDKALQYFRHTSFNGMGVDVADVNSDGLMDVTVMDMLPQSNRRRKLMLAPTNYDVFIRKSQLGYQQQHIRNTFQLNQGIDNQGNTQFSEVGTLKGIHSTDWSWSPLWADYDNDGLLDLYITNGYFKDLTDLDFTTGLLENLRFGTKEYSLNYQLDVMDKLREIKESNFLYKQKEGFSFEDFTKKSGLDIPSFSHGSAFADLDNDGDLELVVNNLNSECFLFKNNQMEQNAISGNNNYLKIKLLGDTNNRNAIGSKVELFYQNQTKTYLHSSVRGYLSSMSDKIHFGLGNVKNVDSIRVQWADGKVQILKNQGVNQTLTIKYNPSSEQKQTVKNTLFSEVSTTQNLDYQHKENYFIDFKSNGLLLKMYSKEGPAMAVGDVNGDGADDLAIGGATGFPITFFIQKNGKFTKSEFKTDIDFEDAGLLFLDVDNDQDDDLYVASGGSENPENGNRLQDRLYINDKGKFTRSDALPKTLSCGGKIAAADYDQDGDLDIFRAGKVKFEQYPFSPKSYILQNEKGKFIDKTPKEIAEIGMINDAIWTDFNNDNQIDLIVVGEWMQIEFFENKKGKLQRITDKIGLKNTQGWWNSVAGGDFDTDGDTDYMVGNFGLNSHIQSSENELIRLYAADFDQSGTIDPILTYFDKNDDGEREEIAWHTRDAFVERIPAFKRRFPTYKSFSEASFEQVLSKDERAKSTVFSANMLKSIYIENLGKNQFKIHDLPIETQYAPVNSILVEDVNADGWQDAILVGNLNNADPIFGNYDASKGTVLLGNGKGGFKAIPNNQSGVYFDGDQKAIVQYFVNQQANYSSTANSERLKSYTFPNAKPVKIEKLSTNDSFAIIELKNGKKFKKEFYYGHSANAQSSRKLAILKEYKSVQIVDFKGIIRNVDLTDSAVRR
jgi:enediyne biosynthesis protein E4